MDRYSPKSNEADIEASLRRHQWGTRTITLSGRLKAIAKRAGLDPSDCVGVSVGGQPQRRIGYVRRNLAAKIWDIGYVRQQLGREDMKSIEHYIAIVTNERSERCANMLPRSNPTNGRRTPRQQRSAGSPGPGNNHQGARGRRRSKWRSVVLTAARPWHTKHLSSMPTAD